MDEATAGENALKDHYGRMLGLKKPWCVNDVKLFISEKRLEIALGYAEGASFECPECARLCWLHDHAPQRQWRHLDAMGFETLLSARVPRVKCPDHGVSTVAVPWAGAHSRFTLAFEAFAIQILQACAGIQAAAELLGLPWRSLQGIMDRAVERGLKRRELEGLNAVGFDEPERSGDSQPQAARRASAARQKSFKRGQSFISHMCDLRQPRVIEVVEGRDQDCARQLWQSLPEAISSRVLDATMDMSAGFAAAARIEAPQARITFDKYHVASHMNKAVDQTRRTEHKELMATGDDALKGKRYLFLYNPEGFSASQSQDFEELLKVNLKAGRAWAYTELFTEFWQQPDRESGKRFIIEWCAKVRRSRLGQMKKVAAMLERHLDGLLNYFASRLTNALCEGFNSRIQQLKTAARGFRSFANYRTRIFFFLGSLDLSFSLSH